MKLKLSTLCSQTIPDVPTGAITSPIFLSSTFAKSNLDSSPEFEYSRVSNPTRKTLETKLAALEHARFALACSSGQAASLLVLSTLNKGDQVILHTNAYDGTFRLTQLFSSFGVETKTVDLTKPKLLQAALTNHTKLIWFETPSNPLLEIIDIKTISTLAHQHRIQTVVDNTILGPCSQKPLRLGADIVIHSLTKIINGHSDLTGGVCITNKKLIFDKLFHHHHTLGIALSPFDCFQVIRGAKTLPIRTKAMEKNALKVARFLSKHPRIEKVIFPGLSNHPQHQLIKSQMQGPGFTISFVVPGNLRDHQLWTQKLRLISIASSFGGTETLIQHPRSMITQTLSPKQLDHLGLTQNLFRLSIGLEDARDIIHDLDQALNIKQ